MASETVVQSLERVGEGLARPYPPSWIDRLIGWIHRLPIPSWLFYLIMLVAGSGYMNAIVWINGKAPVGTIDPVLSSAGVYGIYFLALVGYLNGVAARAFEMFRPALGVSDAEESQLKYELLALPPRGTRVAMILGLGFGTFAVINMPPEIAARISNSTLLAQLETSPIVLVALLFTGTFFYHTIHQLRMVNRIHSRARNINLFQFDPLYAFSALTARTGTAYLVMLYLSFALSPYTLATLAVVPELIMFGLLAVASFVLPLYGMHQRIVAEKKGLESQANTRLQATIAELHRRVDAHELGDADALNKTMASLVMERDVLAKIPTWPWHTGTLNGFIAALLLPLVVWLITRVLTRFGI